jgi:phosphoglycolate phosphatase-like HAD superfamily hydrolase
MGVTDVSDVTVVRRQALKPVELFRRLRDPFPPVSGLLLDVGGVLYDDSVWSRWLLKLVTRLGLHTHYTPFFRVWRREYSPRIKRGECDYWQAMRAFLRSSGLSNGQIDEVEAAGHPRRREFETDIYPLPGVVNGLTRLRDLGIRLTVLSSGSLDTAGVEQQLVRLGLAEFFDPIVTDVQIERAQPGKSCFEAAIPLTGMTRTQLCYVGRDTSALASASTAGLCTVAVNYDDDAEADIYIRHFEQLLESLPWEAAHAMPE